MAIKQLIAIRNLARQDVKALPIVAMTADAFVEDVHHAQAAGMNEHIPKPIDCAQLEQVLQKYLAEVGGLWHGSMVADWFYVNETKSTGVVEWGQMME